jgi:hypothetical protein
MSEAKQTPPIEDIPAGDSAPKPRWRLIFAGAAWGLWVVFLLVMLALRLSETSVH